MNGLKRTISLLVLGRLDTLDDVLLEQLGDLVGHGHPGGVRLGRVVWGWAVGFVLWAELVVWGLESIDISYVVHGRKYGSVER
jgi:hypothetical protein